MYLASIYDVSDTALGPRDVLVIKRSQVPVLLEGSVKTKDSKHSDKVKCVLCLVISAKCGEERTQGAGKGNFQWVGEGEEEECNFR